MVRFLLSVSLLLAVRRCAGEMRGTLIQATTFYNRFKALPTLRCSTAYGTGTQSDKLLENNPVNVNTVRSYLTTDEQRTFYDQLIASPDHDIGVFTVEEIHTRLVYIGDQLDVTSRQTYLNIRSLWDTIDYYSLLFVINTWEPSIHLIMKGNLMCDLMSRMDQDMLSAVCTRLKEPLVTVETLSEYLDRCAYCAGVAALARQGRETIRWMPGYKAKALLDKLKQAYPLPSDWDIPLLTLVPDALTEKDVDLVQSSAFCESTQMERLVHNDFYNYITRGVKIRIAERIRSCVGQPLSSWSADTLQMYAPYIIYLSEKQLLAEMPMSTVAAHIAMFINETDIMRTKFFNAVAWLVETYWLEASGTLDDQTKTLLVCVNLKFAMDDKFFASLSNDEMKIYFELKDVCSPLKISEAEVAPVIELYVAAQGFTWDVEHLSLFGDIMGGVRLSILEAIPTSLFCDNWVSLKDTGFPYPVILSLREKCKDIIKLAPFDSWDCTKIESLGSFLVVVTETEADIIPATAFMECSVYLQEVADRTGVCQKNPALCDVVVGKMKEASGSLSSVLEQFGSTFMKAIDDVSPADIKLDEITSLASLPVDTEMAAMVWKKVTEAYGSVTSGNIEYSSEKIAAMPAVFALGASTEDFINLPEGDGLMKALNQMADHISSMSGKKIEIILDKLKRVFGIDNSASRGVCIEPALAEEVGMYFARASVSDLSKLNLNSLKAVLRVIGQKYEYVKFLSPAKMRSLTKVMLKVDGIDYALSYKHEDLDRFGPYMWCGLDSSQASKLTASALSKYLTEVTRCIHYDSPTRAAIVRRVKQDLQQNGYSLYDRPDMMTALGHFLPDIADDIINDALTIDQTDMVIYTIYNIFFKISNFLDEMATINENEIGKSQRQEYASNVEKLGLYLYSKAVSPGVRKRRAATSTSTCTVLKDFQGQLGFLTESSVQDMTPTDLVDCLDEFQNVSLSDDVLVVLAGKLTAADGLGDPSTWENGDIAGCGKLLDALPASDIEAINFNEQAMAAINHINLSKRTDIVSSYLTDNSISDTSTLTASTLSKMGNLLCGYTVAQIDALNQDEAYKAAKDLCHIACLSKEQLQAFGTKIAASVGNDWASVDPYVVDAMGVCMGGVPSTSLNTLTSEQISNLQPKAINSMPAEVFAEVFDASELQLLSSDQANVVTEEQKAQLGPTQLSSLNSRSSLQEEDISVIASPFDGGISSRCSYILVTLGLILVTFTRCM
ncbi:uncharacterized protein LOC124132950 [Haliotis rufescens]|uniref:uncharacterized protein LOC124132950 n=1 Tax=Haliotis rufescens TaxID=6454 RepID=UPI00201EB913|nr:uncharacterized protein LOC124132950 [Haliotis rufescens]